MELDVWGRVRFQLQVLAPYMRESELFLAGEEHNQQLEHTVYNLLIERAGKLLKDLGSVKVKDDNLRGIRI